MFVKNVLIVRNGLPKSERPENQASREENVVSFERYFKRSIGKGQIEMAKRKLFCALFH